MGVIICSFNLNILAKNIIWCVLELEISVLQNDTLMIF